MNVALRSLLEELAPSGGVLSEAEALGWKVGGPRPAAVVAPATEDEVGRILARAGVEGWRVLPAGCGTWLDGGGPSDVDLVVSTRRMNRILEYEPADLTFTAGAGISLSALHEATSAHGQWLPLDPPGGWVGSLGATVATGSWGPLRQLYGTPRDQVLGVTMVSGEGQVLRWGGRVVKNVAGFDVTRLCVGSWGTLGIVTAVSARLFPIPEADVTLVFRAPAAGALLSHARTVSLSSFPLAAVEILDPLTWPGSDLGSGGSPAIAGDPGPGASSGGGSGEGEAEAGLVLRLLGSRAQVEETESRLRRESPDAGGGEPLRVSGDGSRAFHRELGHWEVGAGLVIRMALLPSDLGLLLEEVGLLRVRLQEGPFRVTPGLRLAAHVGSGVLRLVADEVPANDGGLDWWATNLTEIRGRLEARGGSLGVCHGPGPLLEAVGPWGSPGPEGALMVGLKKGFDPAGTLAPGRLGL